VPVASGAYTSPGDAVAPQPAYYPPQAVGAYAQHPPAGPPPKQGKPLTAIALVIGALLLAGGGTAAALIISGQKKEEPTAAATPAANKTRTVTKEITPPKQKAVTPQPTVSNPAPAATPAPPANNGVSPGAEAEKTVHNYWKTLAAGDFGGAYDYLDPSSAQPRDYWISLRQKDGLYSANFNSIAATSTSSSQVTVSVDFETKQESCRPQHWYGTYTVVPVGSRWLIHRHDLNTPSC
jgi:hypothetical protein